MRHTPIVGQTVYMANKRRPGLEAFEVTKVGKKYFYVEIHGRRTAVHLDSWFEKSDFSPAQFYESETEYENKLTHIRLSAKIRAAIQYGGGLNHLSLDDLQEIHNKIIKDNDA